MLPLAQARLTAPAVAGRGLNEWLGHTGALRTLPCVALLLPSFGYRVRG